MTLFGGEELARALRGVPFPASRRHLAAWADMHCASDEIREGLRHLPDRDYLTWRELINTLHAIEYRATAAGERSLGPAPARKPEDGRRYRERP